MQNISIPDPNNLFFGTAPKPVKCKRGFEIGAGEVYPEINFTLPQMIIDKSSWKKVSSIYEEIIEEVCIRAIELQIPALIVEFELLPPMTLHPEWGAEITKIISDKLEHFFINNELKSALRVTPVDIRDSERPPLMRNGEMVNKMFQCFELCAQAGAEMFSIESTGGKEVHDEALINADLQGIIFSLGILGVSDMNYIWKRIVSISDKYDIIPAGDTACGFANTAMVLADKGMIPKTLAALDRVATVVRSLQAYLSGAIGPSKDCAYEGPYIKAITGIPISMEGKSSACAHLSHLGNIAASSTDLWSNESVQHIKLLSTHAPVVSLEQLAYDCRLMNIAQTEGISSVLKYRDWMVKSDAHLDIQAYILKPEIVVELSERMLKTPSAYEMVVCGIAGTLEVLRNAVEENILEVNDKEKRWLDLFSTQIDVVPEDESELIDSMKSGIYSDKFLLEEYDIN